MPDECVVTQQWFGLQLERPNQVKRPCFGHLLQILTPSSIRYKGSNHTETCDPFSNRHGGSAQPNKPKAPRHTLKCWIWEYKNTVLACAALAPSVWTRKLAGLRFRRKNWEMKIKCSHKWRNLDIFLYARPASKKEVYGIYRSALTPLFLHLHRKVELQAGS